jgi:hypothetical protein
LPWGWKYNAVLGICSVFLTATPLPLPTEPTELPGRRSRWFDLAPPIAVSAVFFAVPLSIAIEFALHFNGVAIDGPFQLYNALRRIDAGFRPGIDFQFFHGIGIPYIQFPWYWLFGRGLPGSELGRQLFSTLLYPAVFLTVFRAFTGTWVRAWWLTATAIAASMALHLTALSNPLNGMLGLRSTIPTLIPAIFWLTRGRRTRIIAIGGCLGAAMFLSTEQGMAAFLAFGVVAAASMIRPTDRLGRAVDGVTTLAIGVTAFLVLVVVVAGRGTAGVLRYNFRSVPMDQFWYFGAPPSVFISSWSALPGMLWRAWPIGLAIVLGVVAVVVRLRAVAGATEDVATRRADALALLAVYGLISCASLLGIFAAAYVQPLWRVLIIAGLIGLTRLVDTRTQSGEAEAKRFSGWMPATAVVAFVWACVAAPSTIPILTGAVPHVLREHVIGGKGFGAAGMWPETLREDRTVYDSVARTLGKPPTLWSTYAGWFEAQHAVFQPSFDYIIHALGPENRARYLATFRSTEPQLVQTVLPTYGQYEPWVETTSWDLYEDLLRRYAIVGRTPWSLFWERQPGEAAADIALGEAPIDASTKVAHLPTVPPSAGMPVTLLTVEVRYRTRNPLSRLPLLGSSPRFLIGVLGAVTHLPITLDPYTTTARFPVVAVPGSSPTLAFQTFSLLPGASFEVSRVRVWQTTVIGPNQAWLAELVKKQQAPPGP